jgi:gliding motility-associated-like protein
VQKLLEFKIFNRWGQLVFETADLTVGWDGMFNGEPQEIGNYAYYFKAESMFGNLVEGSGDIALIR